MTASSVNSNLTIVGFNLTTDRYLRSRALPLGHVERTAAEKRYKDYLDREYEASRKQERDWLRRSSWRRRFQFTSYSQTSDIAAILCESLRVKPLKNIWFESDEVNDLHRAHYNPATRSIHFRAPLRYSCITTLIHEMAHHVCNMEKLPLDHGKDFLWVEGMLFESLDASPEMIG